MSTSHRRAWPPRWPALLAWALLLVSLVELAVTLWSDRLLRPARIPDVVWLTPGNAIELGAAVSAAAVGVVLASRRPRHPVGWLLLGMALSITSGSTLYGYRAYGLIVRPGSLPAAGYLAGLADGFVILWLSCVGFVLLLTPTGTLPSPRWRWWARISAAGAAAFVLASAFNPQPMYPEFPDITSPIGVGALGSGPLSAVIPLGGVIVLAGLVAGAASLVGRYRRARGVERLQLRWLALAAALAAVALAIALAALVGNADSNLFQGALGICGALLPLATGAAILRYRLYDLDRIISRAVSYALLTLLLGGGYAAIVLGLGQLLGRSSSLLVAVATLAVAAAFQPARRRVQRAVDQRFNRRRYDAARTIERFSARLREEVDLDTLSAELLAVVRQTMQPTRAGLWLRPRQEGPPRGGRVGEGYSR